MQGRKAQDMGTKGLEQCLCLLRVVVVGKENHKVKASLGYRASKTLSLKQTKDRRTGIVFCVMRIHQMAGLRTIDQGHG